MELPIYRVTLYRLAEDPYTTSSQSWIFVEEKLVTFSWDEASAYEAEHASKLGPDSCQKLEIESTKVLTTGWS